MCTLLLVFLCFMSLFSTCDDNDCTFFHSPTCSVFHHTFIYISLSCPELDTTTCTLLSSCCSIPSTSQSSIVQNSTGQFRADIHHSNFSCYATIPNIDCTACIDISFSNISFYPNINCTACADISGSNFDCCTTCSIQINCPACTDIDQRLILL